MSWCKNCKEEYINGFTTCPECKTELTEKDEASITKEDNEVKINYDESKLKELFIIENEIQFSLITDALKQDGILSCTSTETLWDHMQVIYSPSLVGQKVLVLENDYDKAKAIYDYFKELKQVWSDENEQQGT